MKALYFDCFSGISGDMCLGALADAGAGLGPIKRELGKIALKGYSISSRRVARAGIDALSVRVSLKAKEPSRKWDDIKSIITRSALPDVVKERSLKCFRRLFEAEAKVHGSSADEVHLHELGATDALVDIVGTMVAVELLGVRRVYASAINVGSGTVRAAHGVLPVPAPATAELLKGIPVFSSGPAFELTTPTGAAIISTLSSGFGPMPPIAINSIGYGAGGRDIEGHPNALRVMVGEMAGDIVADEAVMVVEATIDDMSPQVYEYAIERLLAAGALDAWLTPVIMKKSRPGVVLTVLCAGEAQPDVIETLFRETTTIGVRHYRAGRTVLGREIGEASTPWGKVRVKVSSLGEEVVQRTPEYEDCAALARDAGVPVLDVIDAARAGLRKKR